MLLLFQQYEIQETKKKDEKCVNILQFIVIKYKLCKEL